MVRYIGKRLLQIIPIFFVVSVLIFALVRMSPTEPITVILGGKQSTQAAVQAAQEKFHLNESIVKQYFRWMMGMFHGDFGQSYKFQQSVGSMITERIPVTLGLVGFSSIIGIAIAIPAGVLCAVKKNTWVDRIISIIPVITVMSIQIGAMVVGSVLVENVFALPGLGSLLINAINTSDYPIVQSVMLLLVAVFLILNLIVDIIYAIIDPRIRY